MIVKKTGHKNTSTPFVDTIFWMVRRKKVFEAYETTVTFLGTVSVPVTLIFLTVFFSQGHLPGLLFPQIDSLFGFLMIILGLISALFIHELSHIIILANHGIKAKSFGISLEGVFGGYVQADVPVEDYQKIKLPFFSCGVGANMLTCLLLFTICIFGISELVPFSAATFWFMILNSIPAPLMDGGRIFESLLENLGLERFVDHISASIIIIWILAFMIKYFTL